MLGLWFPALMAFSVASALRLPFVVETMPRGADAWYYLIYRRTLRRTRRFPVHLPQYLLDIPEQWYPPVFPILFSMIPRSMESAAVRFLAPTIESLVAGVVALLASWKFGPYLGIIAGLLYATCPASIANSASLTSRPLGAAVLFAWVMTGASLLLAPSWPLILLSVALVALLLLTHKLSTQQMVALTILAMAVNRSVWPAAMLLGGLGLAVVGSGGFYIKVARGHLDILRFWRRNLVRLGAHQIYDAPWFRGIPPENAHVYATGTPSSPMVRLFKVLYYYGIFGSAVAASIWLSGGIGGLALAVGGVLLTAAATKAVPQLRFLGEGYKYLGFVGAPGAMLIAEVASSSKAGLWICMFGFGLGAVLSLLDVDRLSSCETLGLPDGAEEAFRTAAAGGPRGVMVLPTLFADACTCLTGAPVLWGGHSGGFARLEPYWPVIHDPMTAPFVDAVVVCRDYVRLEDLGPIGWDFQEVYRSACMSVLVRVRK